MNNKIEQKTYEHKNQWMLILPTEDFGDFVHHNIVCRLYLTDIGYFPAAKNHFRERKVGIEAYIFIYCLEGKGTIEVAGTEYHIKKNEAFCIPKFCQHKYYADEQDPWSILWVHFKGDDTSEYPLNSMKTINFGNVNAANRMLFLFESLYQVLQSNYTIGNFIYITQVLSMILAETYYAEKEDSTLSQNKMVTNVIRYMYQHLNKLLSLDGVCQEFRVSKSYMNVIFREYTKETPMNFFIKMKMKEACKLFKSTDMLIYEVAGQLGYKDPYYFSRLFKKIVGVSPQKYKEGHYVYE